MKIDRTLFDGGITIAADRRRGLWSYQAFLFGDKRKSSRVAGQLPASASAHTLLSVALTSALRGFSRKRVTDVTGRERARLLVTVDDHAFIDAMNQVQGARFRAGRNFLGSLKASVSRFDLTFALPSENDHTCDILHDWTRMVLPAPASIAEAVFWPSVVSQ
jgi:hypothetical protein